MNKIYKHPGQPEMQVEVILASKHPSMDKPLVTLRARYPRIIHGEIMTHRVFSRNARSSRAVPVKTMLDEVREKPFIPWHWGKNQKGMQADEECNESVLLPGRSREQAWIGARNTAVSAAASFMYAGYHKQNVNRLLEPFSWIDTLITANEWSNFLWLRDHKDAEPHLQDFACLVKQALDEMDVQELKESDWHTPYITDESKLMIAHLNGEKWTQALLKISAARCAGISYKPFDGNASYEREMERYNLLVNSDRVHASPTEHQATPDKQITLDVSRLDALGGWQETRWHSPHLHGNLEGWIQARKLIPNECHHEG